MADKKKPFRADQVGSLLKGDAVKDARTKFEKGEIGAEVLRKAQDDAIVRAVKLQESAGMEAVTDGEIRRRFWHVDFLTGIDGVEATQSNYAVSFKGEHGEQAATSSMMVVRKKLSRPKSIQLDDFKFLKAHTTHTPKVCIPSATYMHLRGGRKVVPASIYPDENEFWSDLAKVYHAEMRDLAAAGLTYLQIDDVSYAFLCDESLAGQIKADGMDPKSLPMKYTNAINSWIAGRPQGLSITVHTCRGNHKSMWMAEGGYEPVAEAIFAIDADGFFLEFDTDRAGGFEPLRYAPKNKRVVLGLISTKKPQLESKDELKRRIDQAAKFFPLENLCLSPQCGFSSTPVGNDLTEDEEKRKLQLVAEVARDVWGSAV